MYDLTCHSKTFILLHKHLQHLIIFIKHKGPLTRCILNHNIVGIINNLLRDSEPEIRALAVFTVYSDSSSHSFNKLLGNCQTKTCTLYGSVTLRIHLLEAYKKLVNILFLDSDSCIYNMICHIDKSFITRLTPYYHADNSTLCELNGIVCKIDEHLPDTHGISQKLMGKLSLHHKEKLKGLITNSCGHHIGYIRIFIKGLVFLLNYLHFTGFNLRVIKDIIYNIEKIFT